MPVKRDRSRWWRVAGPAAVLAGPSVALAVDPPALNVADPSKFRVTTFASGLSYPTAMQSLGDGSVMIATNATSSGFYSASGQIRRFVDADADGVADVVGGQVLYSGLPGPVTSVRRAGGLFFVTSLGGGGSVISVLREGATPASPLTAVGKIDLGFDADTVHTSYALATRATPGQPGSVDVFFNVGSKANAVDSTNTVAISYTNLPGLSAGTILPDSLYKFTATPSGTDVSLSNLTQIATGLRNAAGIVVHPTSGDLIFEDNGMDGLVDSNEPRSADELNVIPAGDIGGAVEDFGFADDYIDYRTGTRVGSGAQQPLVAFSPIPKPNGAEMEGANEIAIAPAYFPAGLNDGVFIGFHGRFNLHGAANEENPLAYYSFATGEYHHFILGGQSGIGHLDGLLATDDSLFVSDLIRSGSLFSGSNTSGAVYQILALPEPSTAGAISLLAIAMIRRRRKI